MATLEDLVKDAALVLDQQVREPIIIQELQKRGYDVSTPENRAEIIDVANQLAVKVASGEIAPVPMSALEHDGQLSKHASAAVEGDMFALAPEVSANDIDPTQLDDTVKKAAVIQALVRSSM